MALVNGDTVIPAGSFCSVLGVANLGVGSLCPDGLNVGTYHDGGGTSDVVWNNGAVSVGGAVTPTMLRKCTAYTGTDLLGKRVQLTGAGPAFSGPVVQQLNTELNDTNGDGAQVPIVVVQGAGFYFVAETANVEAA